MVILETERLLLRHFHILDGDAMDCVFCDPEVMRFGTKTKSKEWVREWLQNCLRDYHQRRGFGFWALPVHRLWSAPDLLQFSPGDWQKALGRAVENIGGLCSCNTCNVHPIDFA